MPRSCRLFFAIALSLGSYSLGARADSALCGPDLVRLLGDHAQHVFAPGSSVIGALVTLPSGKTPESLGLLPFVPGFARLRASPSDLVSYAAAHPDLHIEVAPPLRPLLDRAGRWIHTTEAHEQLGLDGTGVLVGVADTGLDVSLPDFRDPKTGKSRVAWLLDLSLPPAGLYPDVERQFDVKGKNGPLGAVFQGKDIDAMLAGGPGTLPTDEVGHGTHVTSIAAGNGGPARKYVGGAPGAQIVFARVTRAAKDESADNDDILTGLAFLFDRADAMKLPLSANLSFGSDFGPHDGSTSWEKAVAGFVGDAEPGHTLSVAAGNSGSVARTPIHQTVHVTPGARLSVPIPTPGSADGEVEVWVTFTPGTSVSVGLDGPNGTWIAPVPNGQQGNTSSASYAAAIANGSTAPGSVVPSGSNGAVVVWDANAGPGWPSGTYAITLEGGGTADLWLESNVTWPDEAPIGFAFGVREGTIGLPATRPDLLSVGCTVNRVSWTSIEDAGFAMGVPELDPARGLAVDGGEALPILGDTCDFSSAGPTVTGVPKPEISAPGAWVVAAMSRQANPGSADSIFSVSCPPNLDGSLDPRCLQVDADHAVQAGTSMSAPMVAGAVALLLERDKTLTEGEIVPILQAGAHYFRSFPLGSIEFEDQGGPGELDVAGSLAVMDLMKDPVTALPIAEKSWLSLSTDYAIADGSTPTVALLELRTSAGGYADLFDATRLQPVVTVGGAPIDPPPSLAKRAPGVWSYSVAPAPGSGGQSMTFGATFDGKNVVRPRTIPIATDPWTASYTSPLGGGCDVASPRGAPFSCRWPWLAGWAWLGALARSRLRALRRRR